MGPSGHARSRIQIARFGATQAGTLEAQIAVHIGGDARLI
jgi:hypothetical protein